MLYNGLRPAVDFITSLISDFLAIAQHRRMFEKHGKRQWGYNHHYNGTRKVNGAQPDYAGV
jgi:hypothetical protein